MTVEPRVARQEPRKKLILLYTPFFGGNWVNDPTLGPVRQPFVEGHTTFQDCEIPSCVVTYNRSKISEADAVGFHHRDMNISLPSHRNPQQIWFYFVLENPLNVFMGTDGYASVFNWTMSYRRDSEVYTPYGKYTTLKQHSVEYYTGYEITGKDKLVAWLVSNCQATERNNYVMELQNYINISIYGLCGDSRSCPWKRRSPICNSLLRRHKFYLAFENGNCADYITEKYWENAIGNDIVPIVMGGADYKALAIPNSYIDVQDFASPKHLANYLLYLDGNDTAYGEYFIWKKLYKRVAPNRACTLCKQLHNESLYTPPRVYKNMSRFLDKHQCKRLNL
ncbi:glycoprotein 3-alpha-L-fucosyltransferase A-like [Oculina patagonica]